MEKLFCRFPAWGESAFLVINRLIDAGSGIILFLLLVEPAGGEDALVQKMGGIVFGSILILFHFQGIYRSFRFSTLRFEIRAIFSACFVLFTVLFAMGYILGVFEIVPRQGLVLWFVAWPLCIALMRIFLRKLLRYFRMKGGNRKQAVILGQSLAGVKLARHIRDNPWTGTRVLGFFSENGEYEKEGEINGIPCLGGAEEILHYVQTHPVDIVYVALNMSDEASLLRVAKAVETIPAAVHFVPNVLFLDLVISGDVIFFDQNPVIVLRHTPIHGIPGAVKRCMDFILSLAAVIFLLPVFSVIAVLVKLSSPGPVLFVQKRYGMRGEEIHVYKFRTMHERCDPPDCPYVQATKNDPRVTRVGAFLRKTSLDELPQLINVIQGRMSLVGPRPHPVAMDEHYRKVIDGYMTRQNVKPGITGFAQIKGYRGETETLDKMEKRVEYDIRYIREWSLLFDIEILFRTLVVIVFQKNAY